MLKTNGLIGQTSVFYDHDCMAAFECLGIHYKNNARFTFTSFISYDSTKPKMIP